MLEAVADGGELSGVALQGLGEVLGDGGSVLYDAVLLQAGLEREDAREIEERGLEEEKRPG